MVIILGMNVMRMMIMMELVSSIPPYYTCTENMHVFLNIHTCITKYGTGLPLIKIPLLTLVDNYDKYGITYDPCRM